MPMYRSTFSTIIELNVEVTAETEDRASDVAGERVEEYLRTLNSDDGGVRAYATIDGKGADEITVLPT